MGKIIKLSLVFVLIVLISAAAFEVFASGAARELKAAHRSSRPEWNGPVRDTAGLDRTIRILEVKAGMARLPERTKLKLATMSEREFLLVAQLCNRIAVSADAPGTDFALLLAAALIVLS